MRDDAREETDERSERARRSTTLPRRRRKYGRTDSSRCPITARVVEVDPGCLRANARATLPSANAANTTANAPLGIEDGNAMGGRGECVQLSVAPSVAMVTTELVGSVDGAALVADFARAVEELRDRLELDEDMDAQADASAGPTLNELREFNSRCEILLERGLLTCVSKKDIMNVLSVLERVARNASETLVDANEQTRGPKAQCVLKAIEAIGSYFVILSATDMPKEIYREEGIDQMIEYVRKHLVRNVFVFYDAGLWNVHRGSQAEDTYEQEEIDGDRNRANSKKKVQSRPKSTSSFAQPSTVLKSTLGAGHKVAKIIGAKIGVVFSHLANLISLLALPDATVLQLTSLAFSSFEIEEIGFIQLKAVELVTSIFTQYSEHRGVVVDSVIATMIKIPSETRQFRSFNVPGDKTNPTQIQVLLALFMKCLQGTVEFTDEHDIAQEQHRKESEGDDASSTDVHTRAFGSAFYWTNYFWKDLLARWSKLKAVENERQIRAVINNSLLDALACRNLPEWPVSNLLVLNLAGNLLGVSGLQCKDSKIREVALEFLGQVVSKLSADAKAVENDPFWRELPRVEDLDFTSNAQTLQERAALFAHQDVSRVQSTVSARTRTAMVQKDESNDETFALESILIRYLAENNRIVASMTQTRASAAEDEENDMTRAVQDEAETSSRSHITLNTSALSYHLCQFARDAERAGIGFRQEIIAGGSRSMYAALLSNMIRVAKISKSAGCGSLASLPRELAKSLCLYLNSRRPLARQIGVLVQRVTHMLDDPSVLVRTAAMKAVGSIVQEDERLFDSPEIVRALQVRLKDTGSSVRAAAVDVIGRQIVQNIELADTYYYLLEDRISDVGVLVRKRVVSIMQECLRNPHFTKTKQCMQVLAFRILDEDETIRLHVVKIFRELWFAPPRYDIDSDDEHGDMIDKKDAPHLAIVNGRSTHLDESAVIAARAREIVDVSWNVYSLVSRNGKQKLPLLPSFPMVAILNAVLFPSEDEKLDTWVNISDMKDVAEHLVAQMLQSFMECEAAELSNTSVGADNATSGVLVKAEPCAYSDTPSVPTSVKFALGLHILTLVDPVLCLPKGDPTSFAVALQPYLKRVDDKAPFISEKLQCCMSVIHIVAKHAGRLPAKVAREVERDLRILLLRHHDKPVIYYACKTLCAVAGSRGGKDSGTMAMLKRFVAIIMESISVDQPLSKHSKSHCARSLYVLGNIARFGADIIDAAVASGDCDVTISDLLRVFRKTLESRAHDEFELARGALGACGDLFVARPEYMFNREGGFGKGSFDAIMRAALAPSADRILKEQALSNLTELIREEELRMTATFGSSCAVSDAAAASTKDSVLKSTEKRSRDTEKLQIVNGQSDRSIAGGIAQRYWMDVLTLCVDSAYNVRLKGLHLVEVILRQGLVHPASAFPTLIALQIDPVPSVKRLARKLLKSQIQRHGEFFEHQLTHGVEQTYMFKKKLETDARRREKGALKTSPDPADGFAFVYGLVNSSRTSRNAFLNTLLRRFETTNGASDVLFLRFLANVVTELPFTSVDETLYVIFQLNRVISLKGGLLLEQLACGLEECALMPNTQAPPDGFRIDVELACALSIVLLLKAHIKRAYELSDARVASYVPTEATRNAEIVRFNADIKFETGAVDATAGQTLGAARRAVELFHELMTLDASDFAEDMFKESATRSGRRRRVASDEAPQEGCAATPRAQRAIIADGRDVDEVEEGEGDENDEAFLPGLYSAGVTTGGKKRAHRTAITSMKTSKKLKF